MKRRERVSSFLIVEAGLILLNILCYGDIRWLLLEQILLFPCFNVLKRKKREKEKHLYKDYLKLFLLTKGNSRTVCYRMMDIMQENIASKEPGFLMENCLFSYSWKGSLAAGGVKLNFVKQCSY